jgi:hypothetical protein
MFQSCTLMTVAMTQSRSRSSKQINAHPPYEDTMVLRTAGWLLPLVAVAGACADQPRADARVEELQKRIATLESQIREREANAATTSSSGEQPAGALAAPEALVSFQQKPVWVMPLAKSQPPAKAVADQWVFRLRGPDDNTMLCVDDELHCIALKALWDQVQRPADDASGIREPR